MQFAIRPDMLARKWPPNGWKYRQPETGWQAPSPLQDDYRSTVNLIIQHRKANPGHNLAFDKASVERDLQNHTASRILSENPGLADEWLVALDEAAAQKKTPSPVPAPHPSLRAQVGAAVVAAVRRVKRDVAAARVLAEWVGDGANPVDPQQANARAAVCVACPFNVPGYKIESAIAETIRRHESIRSRVKLRTDLDGRLETCEKCGCYLKLKVWMPIEKILRDKPPEDLPDHCWIKKERDTMKPIVVHRDGAYGDVIATSVVAEAIMKAGFDVQISCSTSIAPIFQDHPTIRKIGKTIPTVNLDGSYEVHRERNKRHIYDLMFQRANEHLASVGINIGKPHNCLPKLALSEKEKADELACMAPYPKPWIAVVPRSNAWPNRTVPENVWQETARLTKGTLFWTGTDRVGLPLVDMEARWFRDVMATIAMSDIVVTVDSGPMHAAAALRKPILAIQQAFKIDLRLTDHSDWSSIGPSMNCLGCGHYYCPIDRDDPPCRHLDPSKLSAAIGDKLKCLDMGRVSAIIAVYKPNLQRITRCIRAIEHQVDEIIIPLDGELPLEFPHPKVRVIQNPTRERTGYGRTIMRGARHSTAGWLFLLNDDCFVAPDIVSKMMPPDSDDKVAIVGGLLRYPNGLIQHGGVKTSPGHVGWGHIDFNKQHPSIKTRTVMDGVCLAAALVRRKAFYEVGGYDDRFDCYGEDYDLCRTLREAGWKIEYEPLATAIHEESQSTGSQRSAMLNKSHELLKLKWLPA